ncbi:MAG: D-cysteine desulfhydrase [Ignavibacteria bacterium]|nr:MAG: D-cysteine desulfhydrase [Ignavibacteria bacterium]KAF0161174.1 MAG: D-cysteine desulfhydrase [Ignavibacteria bacterium]
MNNSEIPRKQLGFFPTPVQKLENLTRYFGGLQIYIKRDDQTGLALGGNKTRKLEYLIGDALAQNCDCVITGGAEQSNHCRQTAAAAAMSGLECHLALRGEEPEEYSGNLLLDKLFNAKIHWSQLYRKGENIYTIAEELKASGKNPYIIPYGGSNKIGALGYVEAINEITKQLSEQKIKIDHTVFASSSGGTHAGMIAGKVLYNFSSGLIGVQIDKEEAGDKPFARNIIELANEVSSELELDKTFTQKDVTLRDDFMESDYGVVGYLERNAIKLLAEKEGILLDPVYTGRVFGGLIRMIENKEFSKDETILFWHTGGAPSLFSYSKELT